MLVVSLEAVVISFVTLWPIKISGGEQVGRSKQLTFSVHLINEVKHTKFNH